MESKAKLFGHPIHPMLIVLPMGLLPAAASFDLLHLLTGKRAFRTAAFWNIGFGLLGGLAAAVFGAVDWFNIPTGTRAKRVGLLHGAGNLGVVALFTGSWLLRNGRRDVPGIAYALSFAGVSLATLTGWLGGELVDRLGVGVDPGANLDAPSSLSDEPADAMPQPVEVATAS